MSGRKRLAMRVGAVLDEWDGLDLPEYQRVQLVGDILNALTHDSAVPVPPEGGVRERIAEALYGEYRAGCMSEKHYAPMWHEAGESTQRNFTARATRIFIPPVPPETDAREALTNLSAWVERYIESGDFRIYSGDWACAECRPDSDMLREGFQCARHRALTLLTDSAVPPEASKEAVEGDVGASEDARKVADDTVEEAYVQGFLDGQEHGHTRTLAQGQSVTLEPENIARRVWWPASLIATSADYREWLDSLALATRKSERIVRNESSPDTLLWQRMIAAARFLRACRGTEPAEYFEEHAQYCMDAANALNPDHPLAGQTPVTREPEPACYVLDSALTCLEMGNRHLSTSIYRDRDVMAVPLTALYRAQAPSEPSVREAHLRAAFENGWLARDQKATDSHTRCSEAFARWLASTPTRETNDES